MDDPIAVALKFGFLAVLYLFLLWVARSSLRDLAGHREADAAPPPESDDHRERPPDSLRAGLEPRLVVVAAMGFDPGTVFDLSSGATMGRADNVDIHVDDPFASSAHARIYPRQDFMYVEDMGSTNGTYLNGRELRGAERLKVSDTVRIGDSEYRYEE
ncbi:MAG: FHA domain-containing protein [Thermoleophilaceae bacterium]|nr:FHA domain-containing protein [Thermoleophilaceae bacterium]